MPGPRPRLTAFQIIVLGLLAAGGCGLFGLLAILIRADQFVVPPQVAALLPFITLTPRPPTSTPSITPTPLPSATATITPSPTTTGTATDTPLPTLTPTDTATPTITPSPTPTFLWPSPVAAALASPTTSRTPRVPPPSLADFWNGRATWQLERPDVGLPIGESDTLIGPDGRLWSYLHASTDSRGIHDQFGAYVPFPGCVTLWVSGDRGLDFDLFAPRCLLACRGFPCGAIADDIDQQQYPRVARATDGTWVMVYEWRAETYLRTSADGLNWTRSRHVPGTGNWDTSLRPCQPYQRINDHPFLPPGSDYQCLSGAPPGLYVEGDTMYVFVAMGKNPSHMGCYVGLVADGAPGLKLCGANPLFQGAASYGPADLTGAAANPYFDFRTVSAADVVQVGARYYMTYEGVRGPGPGDFGDTQFNLGLARSAGPNINGPWEKYPGNPILGDVPGNVGVGHADLLLLDGITYLYTATTDHTRGRYKLIWR
ncbi:MAG: hypothetical protein ABI847_08055 [Anaerolineales bacterium]